MLGWLRVAVRVLRGSARSDHGLRRCRSVDLLLACARPSPLDGDLREATRALRVDVEPRALTVRSPR